MGTMGTMLDKEWISCCKREDVAGSPQPPYLHKCGCPVVEVFLESVRKSCSLKGFEEFVDSKNGINASVPAQTYLRRDSYLESFIDQTWGCCGSPEDGFSKTAASFSVLNYGLDYEELSALNSTSVEGDTNASFTRSLCGVDSGPFGINIIVTDNSDTSSTATIFHQINGVNHPWNGQYRAGADSNTSAFYKDTSANSNSSTLCDYDDMDYRGRLHRTVLSIPDTEENAIARANPSSDSLCPKRWETQNSNCTSLWEVRTDTLTFVKSTATYVLRGTNLQIGAIYTARVLIERRPAIKNPSGSGYVDENGDPSEWTTLDDDDAIMLDEYTFTATASEMLVPTTGTWADANSDGTIDEIEVTPLIELPHVKGWEYRIAIGYPKIELAS